MKIDLNRDWSELLCALIGRRMRFVLIGGHAVAGHGEPRFTEDIDVFGEPTLANARRLRAALVDFGFSEGLPPAKDLLVGGGDGVSLVIPAPPVSGKLSTLCLARDGSWAGGCEVSATS